MWECHSRSPRLTSQPAKKGLSKWIACMISQVLALSRFSRFSLSLSFSLSLFLSFSLSLFLSLLSFSLSFSLSLFALFLSFSLSLFLSFSLSLFLSFSLSLFPSFSLSLSLCSCLEICKANVRVRPWRSVHWELAGGASRRLWSAGDVF